MQLGSIVFPLFPLPLVSHISRFLEDLHPVRLPDAFESGFILQYWILAFNKCVSKPGGGLAGVVKLRKEEMEP